MPCDLPEDIEEVVGFKMDVKGEESHLENRRALCTQGIERGAACRRRRVAPGVV